MKIGIDATPLSGNLTGIGRYVYRVCCALETLMPTVNFYLYSPLTIHIKFPSERWHVCVEGRHFPSSYVWLKRYVKGFCVRDGIDVFWATRTITPIHNATFKILTTVHDLNYLIYPEYMPPVTKWAHRLWFAYDVRTADAVVAVSEGTASRIKSHYGIQVDDIAPPAVSPIFGDQDKGAVKELLQNLSIDNPYFLAVGTLEPRKNMEALFQAFINLKIKGELQQYKLILVGGRGWKDRKVHQMIQKYKKYGIIWIGRVSDSQLAKLYAGAAAFVMPSLYEGFGIPLLEARVCGIPVLSTDIPEMREAGGENGLYVDPTVKGIEEGLLRILTYHQPHIKVIPEWFKTAQIISRVMREIVSQVYDNNES